MSLNAQEIAEILLDIGCLELSPSEPFSYASGLKGPIYCDNRKILSHPAERKKIIETFVIKIKEQGWSFDALAGLATAGIPHAALIAGEMNLPMVYIRGKAKSHGKSQQIEGDYRSGQSLLLVEDLINQGASLDEALRGVKNAELKSIGCLSIVSYSTPAALKVISNWNLDSISLTNLDAIGITALKKKMISQEEFDLLKSWQQDPAKWSELNGN